MIALNRTRTENAIKAKYRGVQKRMMDKELLENRRTFLLNSTKPQSFKTEFWKLAKAQLKKESFGKCAYCEANASVVAHGDVEHYRPKSVYWWLAYTYDNYLYACQICNQVYKSDNFPFSGTAFPGPALLPNTTKSELEGLCGNISPDPLDFDKDYSFDQYKQYHSQESALLLNPYIDDPESIIAYQADDILQEVKVIPTRTEYTQHIQAMEDYYGINRIELKNLRYQVYALFQTLKMAYAQIPDEVVKKQVDIQLVAMKSGKYVFAGMNRYFDKHIKVQNSETA